MFDSNIWFCLEFNAIARVLTLVLAIYKIQQSHKQWKWTQSKTIQLAKLLAKAQWFCHKLSNWEQTHTYEQLIWKE